MTTIDPAAVQTPEVGSAFGTWLKYVPGLLAILAAAGSAVAGKLLPQSAIPEPLNGLREFGALVGMGALLLTWILRASLRKHVLRVFAATATFLVLLIVCYQMFVTPVHYRTTDESGTRTTTKWFITGWNLADPDPTLKGLTAEELIHLAGEERDGLRTIWGRSFDIMAFTYMGLYSLVMIGIVLTVAGIDFGQTDPPTRAKLASPQPVAGSRNKNKKKRR